MWRRNLLHAFLLAGLMLTITMAAACRSSGDASSREGAGPPKPIDRVRGGIVEVRDQLEATLASADHVVADPGPGSRSKRSEFRNDLEKTRSAVQTLRADATELRVRANEYLTLWSGQTTIVTAEGSIYTGAANDARQRSKAKYDEMVGSLQQARDEVLPLMDELDKLQTAFEKHRTADDLRAVNPGVQQARQRETRAVAHLNTALASLDELRAMLPPKGVSQER
jgi:hypothetical protein